LSVQTGAIALVSVVDVLISKVGGRPIAIYLQACCVVNVLSIDADVANNADNVDNVGDVNNINNIGNADLAKTLLLTLTVFLFVVK
jgi:hypothetical protein